MLGELIGKGNTADVFDIGNNKVVKLFQLGYPKKSVEKEFKNSKQINNCDIHTVKSYEIIEYNGRYGILYDKIDGISMLDLLLDTQDLDNYAKLLAMLHKKIIAYKTKMPFRLKTILKKNIEKTDKVSRNCKVKLLNILNFLPEGNCLCHGDFHFGNIMANQEKYYVIDYMNVCQGHKFGDIARTVYLIEMTPVPSEANNIDNIYNIKKQVTDIYLKEMCISREILSDWLMITAAARLSELNAEQIDETNAILEYLSDCGLKDY